MKKIIILLILSIPTGALFAEGNPDSRLSSADLVSLSESINIYLSVTRGERSLQELSDTERARYDFVQELVSTERVSLEQLEASNPRPAISKSAAAARLIELTRPDTPFYWGARFGVNAVSSANLDISDNSALFGLLLGSHLDQRRWFWEVELNHFGASSDTTISTPSSTRTDLSDNELSLTGFGVGIGRRWQSNIFLSYLGKVGFNILQVDAASSLTVIDSADSNSGVTTSDSASDSAFAPYLNFGVELTEYNNFLIRAVVEYSSFSSGAELNNSGTATEVGSSSVASLALSVNFPLE